ncbi:thiosulfate:glutathione sulfurtransferase [Lampris incognitus]|uniref:thiosulfate:glutathione sulfurtransferase n=1 Tax=Lampris incognitus TaxID=2546036 RepID=UPI0024B53356|nr:thiosulfate:glutathione sulfurtransferase [Lampris incognitus]
MSCGAVVTMLACVLLSRSLCQAAAKLNGGSVFTSALRHRGHTTSPPAADTDSVVTYEQLKTMLASHDVQLFDVRNPDEFQAGRIPDSVNIPLGDLEESLKLSPEKFELVFQVKPPEEEDENVVFHCQRGNRSAAALHIARQLGFSRARHYKGGYSEWAAREGN